MRGFLALDDGPVHGGVVLEGFDRVVCLGDVALELDGGDLFLKFVFNFLLEKLVAVVDLAGDTVHVAFHEKGHFARKLLPLS